MSALLLTVFFLLGSAGLAWVSRASLRDPRSHGFYRFFSWESILLLFLLNADDWFIDPFGLAQILSWTFLSLSLVLILLGVHAFRRRGRIDMERKDPALVGIEKTTALVTTGIYCWIRHPFYGSLLLLGWGICLKYPDWIALLVAMINSVFLTATARVEERENVRYFGGAYQEYMRKTRMFVPFLF